MQNQHELFQLYDYLRQIELTDFLKMGSTVPFVIPLKGIGVKEFRSEGVITSVTNRSVTVKTTSIQFLGHKTYGNLMFSNGQELDVPRITSASNSSGRTILYGDMKKDGLPNFAAVSTCPSLMDVMMDKYKKTAVLTGVVDELLNRLRPMSWNVQYIKGSAFQGGRGPACLLRTTTGMYSICVAVDVEAGKIKLTKPIFTNWEKMYDTADPDVFKKAVEGIQEGLNIRDDDLTKYVSLLKK